MNKFAEAFRKERIDSGTTFRQISNATDKSIGYLSDIDSGRKNPPEIGIVRQIEKCLGITDGRLVKLAEEVRITVPNNLNNIVTQRPQLGEFLLMSQVLLREDETFSTELDTYLEAMRNRMKESGLEPFEIDSLLMEMSNSSHYRLAGQVINYE